MLIFFIYTTMVAGVIISSIIVDAHTVTYTASCFQRWDHLVKSTDRCV